MNAKTTLADDWQEEIRDTLASTKIAFLSTQGGETPETSMTPFAINEDSILLHLSSLARHSKNLSTNTSVGLMVCTPEQIESSPLSLPRISFQGKLIPVAEKDLGLATKIYLSKVPDAEPLFSFSDFTLYKLVVKEVYWIGGFGKARKVSMESWRKLCR